MPIKNHAPVGVEADGAEGGRQKGSAPTAGGPSRVFAVEASPTVKESLLRSGQADKTTVGNARHPWGLGIHL